MSERIVVQDGKSNTTVVFHTSGQSEPQASAGKAVVTTPATGNSKPTVHGTVNNSSVVIDSPA